MEEILLYRAHHLLLLLIFCLFVYLFSVGEGGHMARGECEGHHVGTGRRSRLADSEASILTH